MLGLSLNLNLGGTVPPASDSSFNPYAVAGMTFGFEARNQGAADAETVSTITDESGNSRNLTGAGGTTFTYNAATASFAKTTTSSCMANLITSGFYGPAVTIIVVGKATANTGAFASLVSSSAHLEITSGTNIRYNLNQESGAVNATGTYTTTSPFMVALRIINSASALLRVNDQIDVEFNPADAYNSNTFFRLGSLTETTPGLSAEYAAAYTFARALSDVELSAFYNYIATEFL